MRQLRCFCDKLPKCLCADREPGSAPVVARTCDSSEDGTSGSTSAEPRRTFGVSSLPLVTPPVAPVLVEPFLGVLESFAALDLFSFLNGFDEGGGGVCGRQLRRGLASVPARAVRLLPV